MNLVAKACLLAIGVALATSPANAQTKTRSCFGENYEAGEIIAVQGGDSVQVRRRGLTLSIGRGAALCTGDELRTPARVVLDLRVDPAENVRLAPNQRYVVPSRENWFQSLLRNIGLWDSYRDDQRFAALGGNGGTLSSRAKTLGTADTGDYLYFAVAGLDAGTAVLSPRKGLAVWTRSPAGQRLTLRIVGPEGKVAFETTGDADTEVIRAPDLVLTPGVWRLEITGAALKLEGGFRVGDTGVVPTELASSTIWTARGDLDRALSLACVDPARYSFEALQMIATSTATEKARGDAGAVLSFWRHPSDQIGCAPPRRN